MEASSDFKKHEWLSATAEVMQTQIIFFVVLLNGESLYSELYTLATYFALFEGRLRKAMRKVMVNKLRKDSSIEEFALPYHATNPKNFERAWHIFYKRTNNFFSRHYHVPILILSLRTFLRVEENQIPSLPLILKKRSLW